MSGPALRRKKTQIVLVLFVLLMFGDLGLQIQTDKTTIWNYLFNVGVGLFYFIGAAAALKRGSRLDTKRELSAKNSMFYFGLAGISYGIASCLWALYNLHYHVDVPYPAWTDLFYVAFYPLVAVALWNLHKSHQSRITTDALADSILIFFLSGALVFLFLRTPEVSTDQGLLTNILNIAYTMTDVFLLAMAFIELKNSRFKKDPAMLMMVGFLLLQALGDFIFSQRSNAHIYWNGDLSDVLFAASGLLFVLSIMHKNLLKIRV